MLRRVGVSAVATVCGGFGVVYVSSPGFRRSVRFWGAAAPFIIEYEVVKIRAYADGASEDETNRRISDFHQRTAARAVDIILELGGIYVKIGQFASTMGAGILEDAYITALQPLQDGVPPRPLEEVVAIIEGSVGLPMSVLFSSFDPKPLGAASIAQAHCATLQDGRKVYTSWDKQAWAVHISLCGR